MPHLMSYTTTACVRGRLVMTHICTRRRGEMCERNAYAAENTASQLLAVQFATQSANNIAWLIRATEMRKVEWRGKNYSMDDPREPSPVQRPQRRSVCRARLNKQRNQSAK